ncbi:hypothetical protein [Salipiger sp. PrR003]|uniref:type IV toxin-antitoxin system AbiEi family antitoxin domain-containing protein n=1 Tax=Salipiger sp. PrR003 TaxID=2706776 RepID=UPI0013DABC9A|nr:hypothetical protein [Salipiger sp. PrR003]NDV50628.1 hypothetical protein [Salipiger sp. PrR003]
MGPKMREGIEVMSDGKVYTSRELRNKGVNKRVLARLKEGGYVHEIGRGRYFLDEEYVTGRTDDHDKDHLLEDFARAALTGGEGSVICLYSAAQWHDLSIDMVPQVQVGVPRSRGPQRAELELVQFVRWRAQEALHVGVGVAATYKGVEIRVTDAERTLVDLLRYSPLANLGDNSGLLIDEESVTEAFALYFKDPRANPARLIAMAERFNVREPVDLIIKSSQKDIGIGAECEAPRGICP